MLSITTRKSCLGEAVPLGSFRLEHSAYHSARIKTAQEAIDRARSQIDLRKAENYGMCGRTETKSFCLNRVFRFRLYGGCALRSYRR